MLLLHDKKTEVVYYSSSIRHVRKWRSSGVRFVEAQSIEVLTRVESKNVSFESQIRGNINRSQKSIIEIGFPCQALDPDTRVQIEGERVIVASDQNHILAQSHRDGRGEVDPHRRPLCYFFVYFNGSHRFVIPF